MNTELMMVAALFFALAAVFVIVLPRLWQRDVRGESVIDWLNLRQTELGAESVDLLEEAQLRVVEELEPANDSLSGSDAVADDAQITGKMRGLLLLLVCTLATVWLYGYLGAQADVDISRRLESIADASPAEVQGLVDAIALRVESRPENIDYLSLLGEYYTGSEQPSKALEVYEQLLAIMPENPDVLARAAQSEFLVNNRQLSSRAERRAQAALAAAPNQRAALGTLGMAAFEAENYADAVRYWERLARLERPGSNDRVMIERILITARERAGLPAIAVSEPVVPSQQSPEVVSDSGSKSVPESVSELGVNISITGTAALDLSPTATVFVLARAAGSTQRMPVAVQRFTVADLPTTIRLDDGNSMAGQKLSVLPAVDIEVQVSPSGQPGLRNATWVANATGVVPSVTQTITLSLMPAAP